jgi:hypothetical protein
MSTSLTHIQLLNRLIEGSITASFPALGDDDRVAILAEIRERKTLLGLVEQDLVEVLAEGHKNNATVNDQYIVKRAAPKYVWDRPAANNAIMALGRDMAAAEAELVDPDTGEKVASWDQCLKWCDKFWLRGNPKTTPMNDHGMDVSEFRASESGAAKVELL